MRRFVLLATRAEDGPADEEYALFLRYTGLAEHELQRVRLEAEPMPHLDLDDLSGIFIGGSPFNTSDPAESKSAVQVRVETECRRLLVDVVARDFPFLGACYGVGTLGAQQGAVIDRTYGEPVGIVDVTLTEAGRADPLCAELSPTFAAFVGHKEAMRSVPSSAVLLASSATCPVQMFRVGQNVYATQFHPELDVEGITSRIHAYAEYGYFSPDALHVPLGAVTARPVTESSRILRAFVERYAR